MNRSRSLVATAMLSLAAAQAPVEPPAFLEPVTWLRPIRSTVEPKFVIVSFANDLTELREQAPWLDELQARHRDEGVLVVAVLPEKPDAGAERLGTAFALGHGELANLRQPAAGAFEPERTVVCDPAGTALWAGEPGDGLTDALRLARAGRVTDVAVWAGLRTQLRDDFENSDDQSQALRTILTDCPHDGFSWGALYLSALWFAGDLEAAATIAKDALKAIDTDGAGLLTFADLVLRGNPHDQALAEQLALVLAPVAAVARENASAQLTWLRAQLRADRTREAARLAQTLPKLLTRPGDQLRFATLLASAREPLMFKDLAQQAVTRAKATVGDSDLAQAQRQRFAAEYAVARRCLGDAKAAADVLAAYQKSRAFTELYEDLNNDAWYAVTALPTMGHHDQLALGLVEALVQQEGAGLSFGNRDTVALVLFLNGQIDAAIEHQQQASEQGGNQKEYVARLQRYERTKERLAARK
ncbi:MAG: hypothetical protein IPK26_09215 [Planctomycetes bacterium]|nr:hypothetical protein [Planctomycetota bacterium]